MGTGWYSPPVLFGVSALSFRGWSRIQIDRDIRRTLNTPIHRPTAAGRTDPDHYERSPSTGAEETARILDARDGYDHEPPSDDGDAEPVTIDAVPPAEEDGRTDTDTDADHAPRSREVFA